MKTMEMMEMDIVMLKREVERLNRALGIDTRAPKPKGETPVCIFCGESGGNDMRNPQTKKKRLKGPYHWKCRSKIWSFGRLHPELQMELNRKYGLEWDISKHKTVSDYGLELGSEKDV
jgi:hypothetical protein